MRIDGTNIRESTGIPIGKGPKRKDSRQDAEEIYRAAMGDVARGAFKIPTKTSPRTFREQAEWYRDHVAKHHRGGRREISIIEARIAAFGDEHLRAIDAARIEEWKTARAAKVKRAA